MFKVQVIGEKSNWSLKYDSCKTAAEKFDHHMECFNFSVYRKFLRNLEIYTIK